MKTETIQTIIIIFLLGFLVGILLVVGLLNIFSINPDFCPSYNITVSEAPKCEENIIYVDKLTTCLENNYSSYSPTYDTCNRDIPFNYVIGDEQ